MAGNGGSSSTASTFVNDVGFDKLWRSSKDKIKIVSLNDNIPLTAISNDLSFLLMKFLKVKSEINFQKGDILIVFSGSGKLKNLINAVQWIKERNLAKLLDF